MKRAVAICGLVLVALAGTSIAWRATASAEPPLTPVAALTLNGGVPCICPQWPVGTYGGMPVYAAEEYYSGDDDCLYPYQTYYIGDDAGDWPYVCDNCLGNAAARAPETASFDGLPKKIRWNEGPDFPTQAARDGAHIVSEDFVEFKNPLTKAIHRAKLFIIKAIPDEASHRPGDPRMLAVGFEVENNPRSEPTFRLDNPRRIRQVNQHSKHAFRLHVGAVQYVVFLAKD
jgi:hypothetical protein